MDYIDLIRKHTLIYLSVDELSKSLKNYTNESLDEIKFKITNFIKDGTLFLDDAGRVSISADRGYIKAKLNLNKKGYGFAVVGNNLPDIFIPAFAINGAFDGDDCLVEIIDAKSRESVEGKIVKILKRNTTHIVGTYIVGKSKNVVLPDDERLPQIRIYKGNSLTAKNNEKVWVEIDSYFENKDVLTGKIIEVLGLANTPKAEQLSIIRAHKLSEKFEESTLNEAKNIAKRVDKTKFKNRQDFTDLNTITIDGEDARDFDDAISLQILPDGYKVYVHIADVSHYVVEGSALDKEAEQRGTSVYFPNQVIPMLPKELSNGICSLNEGEDRLTLSVVMDFDKNLKFISAEIFESIIQSKHRMTYTEIGAILEGNEILKEKYADVYNDILFYQRLSNVLKDEHFKRGEIRFNLPEPLILENEDGEIVSISSREQDEPHEIIESLMIKANEVVAELAFNKKLPFVYRVHEKPDSEKVTRLAEILKGMGIANTLAQEGETPQAYQKIIEKITGTPKEKTLTMLTLRTMMKARYAPTCMGHFGLASTYYCHFTSPIRRYPDLMIHRLLKMYLSGVPASEIQKQYNNIVAQVSESSSALERNADEAEREVDDYKKAVYMAKFLGEEFEGTISGVQEYGLFIELDNGIEGLLRTESLPYDEYVYNERSLILSGNKFKYEIGDRIKVVVVASNPRTRNIDFDLPQSRTIKDFLTIKNVKSKQQKKNKLELVTKSKKQKNNKNSLKNIKNNIKNSKNKQKNSKKRKK